MSDVVERQCVRIREDLSGFVDHTLPPRRWERVGYHVAGCDSCRAEAEAIRAVCSTLSVRCNPAGPPVDLSERLHDIAGEARDQPLYLTVGKPCGLPSKRAALRRGIQGGGVVVTSLLVSVLAIALMLAPEPRHVSNSVEEAQEDFSVGLAALGLDGALGVGLLAHQQGATLDWTSLPTRDVFKSVVIDMDDDTAAQLIEQASADSFDGVERVWFSNGTEGGVAVDVTVTEAPDGASVMSVLGAENALSVAVPERECCHTEAPDGWDFVSLLAPDVVAGRPARIVEAQVDGAPRARWWVDVESGRLLWTERYDAEGNASAVAGYVELGTTGAGVDANTVARVASPDLTGVTWCVGLLVCPESLAGLPLVSATGAGTRRTHLVYSDGFRTLTVGWSDGVLDANGATRVTDTSVLARSAVAWQTDGGVLTVVTDAGPEALDEVAGALPRETRWSPTLRDRVIDGLQRIAQSR